MIIIAWNNKGVCKVCRRKQDRLSQQRLCFDCGMAKMHNATKQMAEKQGFYWKKWKRGMKQYVKTLR